MQQLMEATVKGNLQDAVLHLNLAGRFEGYRFKREPVLRNLLAGLPLTVLQQRKALIIGFSAAKKSRAVAVAPSSGSSD